MSQSVYSGISKLENVEKNRVDCGAERGDEGQAWVMCWHIEHRSGPLFSEKVKLTRLLLRWSEIRGTLPTGSRYHSSMRYEA